MRKTHLGILGGGQLGMLLIRSAIQFPVHVSIYDPHPKCPASYFTNNFFQGDFDDYEKIVEFGKDCDIIIFETEKVNIDALKELERQGKKVCSNVSDLEWIQNKAVQKEKLQTNGFPVVAAEKVVAGDVKNYQGSFPGWYEDFP